MPHLRPFTPVRFAADPGADVSSRIAPPYDVLDEGPKQALLATDPQNVVAIDLPVTPPKTVGPDAAYEQAGRLYRQWLDEGVLVREDRPAVVAYEQVYVMAGRTVRRRGMFAVLGVEDFNRPGGGIFRHEMTIAGGIGDRTKLMSATCAQLSPIFGIFPDAGARVAGLLSEAFDGRSPDFSGTTGGDGVLHRCWLIHEPATLDALAGFFEATDVFIADGHHRYTTALDFSKTHPDLPGADGCLFVLVAAEDPGMIVLPTHRVITGLCGFSMQRLREVVAGRDDLVLTEAADDVPFTLVDPATGQAVGLALSDPDPLAGSHAQRPAVWRRLDVAILQHLVVEQVLGPAFGEAGSPLTYRYTADADEARRLASEGGAGSRLAVLMRSTPLASVMAVSRADDVMPPKSTYFYPKLATGLVINPLDQAPVPAAG